MTLRISLNKRLFFTLAVFTAILVIAAMIASPALAQSKQVKKIPLKPETAALMDGQELYQAACAVCHGKTGMGDGPAAAALKTPTPNLTTLARQNGGEFPASRVVTSIQGKLPLAHGDEDMPMWGTIFRGTGSDALAALRIANLTGYIRSLQVK